MMKSPARVLVLCSAAVVSASCVRHSGALAVLNAGTIPIFETRFEVATGNGVHSDYCVADFDGDHKLDMAVLSLTGELRVLLGNGLSFVPAQSQSIGGGPIWIAGADFDEDGDIDLVIVRSFADSTEIWLNDGHGVFTQGASLPVGDGALAVAVGDLDHDGHLDVAVSRSGSPELVVGFGDGHGAFSSTQQIPLPGGGEAFNVAIGDVSRDGIADLVVADPQLERIVIFPGSSQGFGQDFVVLDVPGRPGAVSLGDLSGDGLTDMVVSAYDANKYVVITDYFVKDGLTTWGYSSFDVPVSARPSLSTIADVTGDGRPDLVGCLAFNASMVVVPQAPGGGVDSQLPFDHMQLDATGFPLHPFVGDIDGTGRIALFALSGGGDRVNVWVSKPTGELAGARNYNTSLPIASWLEGADFDGDGDFEVATGSYDDNHLVLMGRDANGKLVTEATIDLGFGIYQLKAKDLDGDGKIDLVVGVHGGIKLLHNLSTPGHYNFELLPASPVTIASGDFPFGIVVADLDGDNHLDIAVCDYAGGGVHVVPGTETPFSFGTETVVQLGGGPVDVVAADFTGDGVIDLAVSRATAGDIVGLRNVGGSFVQYLTQPVGQTPNYLVTADFNRDGRADLVVSNAGSGTVSVLFGGSSGFTVHDYPAGATPTTLLARDLTGDGVPDILVTSLVSGDFRVLVGDGKGGFPLLPTFPGTLGASDAVLQDMDNDGLPDLLITSLITNRVSLVKNITVLPAAH
jgi:hypothetical protein